MGRLELRGGQVEVEVLARAGDIHVVQNVALDIQVEGTGGEAGGGIVKLLREQVIKKTRRIRTADAQHAALRAVDGDGPGLGRTLFPEGIAIVPGHTLGIEYSRVLVLGGTGALKKWRRITHIYRW